MIIKNVFEVANRTSSVCFEDKKDAMEYLSNSSVTSGLQITCIQVVPMRLNIWQRIDKAIQVIVNGV